jgi:hypothetical protein
MRSIFVSAFAFCVIFVPSLRGQAPQAADISTLRAQIDSLRTDYEKRIKDLETQLADIQAQMLRNAPESSNAADFVAAEPTTTPTSAGALNPAISVVGNFVARVDDQKVFNTDGIRIDNSMNLREAEIDMRVPIDPYADGVLITSLESETPGDFEVGVEEGYVNIKKLPFLSSSPLGMKFQVGRFRPAFGKFNTLHTHDLPQSMRSLATEEFLGNEGFVSNGISSDFFVPTPWDENSSLNARLQVLTGGKVNIAPESGSRLAYVGNLRWFKTFAGTHNTEVAWSSYLHPGRSGEIPMTRLHGVDFMYRWKPFRQGEWKSYLVGGELFFSDKVEETRPYGSSIFTQWQFDRRKYAGVRWDYSTTIADPTLERKSVTPYLSYYFSEFLRFRLNFEHRWSDLVTENNRNSVFMELNWIFGAHPPEPFWVNR